MNFEKIVFLVRGERMSYWPNSNDLTHTYIEELRSATSSMSPCGNMTIISATSKILILKRFN